MRMFIIGTGSHARKIYHYAMDSGWQIAAFIDEARDAASPIDSIPLVQLDDLSEPVTDEVAFVAIGHPDVRRRIMDRLASAGWIFPSIVHRTAWVAPDSLLEDGVLVAAGAVVESGSTVARGAIIDIGVLVDHDCCVEAFCHLRPGEIYGPRSVIATPAPRCNKCTE